MGSTDTLFAGSIPALYDRYLGPMLFEPYAEDLAGRLARGAPRRVLETAAGTGIVTAVAAALLPDAQIVATDLNQAMLDVASARIDAPGVSFRQADAQDLPFDDASFDAVICQFGAMFFPDRLRAYREARRVLRPGGRFLFNVWDRLEANPVSEVVAESVAALFPEDPPGFYRRVPFGYHDIVAVEQNLLAAGFISIEAETVPKRSRIGSARDAAVGLCEGTPLRSEIEARDASRLPEAVRVAEAALAPFAGSHGVDAPMSAHVFTAVK